MLEIKNICAGYDKKRVISDISFEVERGSVISVIGPNGCGKSTLMRSIAGIIDIYNGETVIDGEPAEKLGRLGVARKISYLAQGKSVPDMTVGQMVLHGRFPHLSYPRRYSKRDREIARDAMSAVGVLELEGCPMNSLSGGMRQNAYIAMALAQDSDYILLDEPTTYLDASHQMTLMDMLCGLSKRGKGIVAVLHDIPLALGYSDKILLMHEGRVLCFGSPDEVLDSGMIEKVLGLAVSRDENGGYYTSYKRKI